MEIIIKRLLITTVIALVFAITASPAPAHRNLFSHPSPIVRGLLCIHHYEGSWQDPNSPYWGGLQMDLSFQSTYGWIRRGKTKWSFLRHWGTADHWPVWAQIVAGIHGFQSRGWHPWPRTAHNCGLL